MVEKVIIGNAKELIKIGNYWLLIEKLKISGSYNLICQICFHRCF